MTEIAKAYVQIIPTTKDFGSNLRSAMGSDVDSAGSTAGESWASKFGAAAKRAIAALGIGKMVGDALNSGAEYEQNLGGTEAVFGEFAKNIQDTAKSAYENMGMSASEYMATANKMGSLFQGSGLEQQRALELTSQAMQRAADVASVMGIDTSMAMESIAGAAKGNFTMMDNLGVAMNATTLEAYALEKGVNFKWNTASNAEKAELAMQMFFERTQQYAGNFARESAETFSGSLGAMKAAWENTLATLTTGGNLTPVLQQLGTTVHNFIFGNLIPMLKNLISAIPGMLGDLSGMLIQELNHVSEHTDQLVAFAVDVVTGLVTGFAQAAPNLAVAAVNLAMSLAQSLISFDWIGTATAMIQNIRNHFDSFAQSQFGSDQSVILGIIQGINNTVSQLREKAADLVKTVLSTIIQNLPQIISAGVQLVGQLVIGLLQSIPDIISSTDQLIRSVISAFSEVDWGSLGRDIINGIISGLSQLLPNLVESAKNVAQSAWETAKGWLGINSPSKKFAELGLYSAEGFAEGMQDNTSLISSAAAGISDIAMSELSGSYSVGLAAASQPRQSMSVGSDQSRDDLGSVLTELSEVLIDLRENGVMARTYLNNRDVTDYVSMQMRRSRRAGGTA